MAAAGVATLLQQLREAAQQPGECPAARLEELCGQTEEACEHMPPQQLVAQHQLPLAVALGATAPAAAPAVAAAA